MGLDIAQGDPYQHRVALLQAQPKDGRNSVLLLSWLWPHSGKLPETRLKPRDDYITGTLRCPAFVEATRRGSLRKVAYEIKQAVNKDVEAQRRDLEI